MRSTTRHFSSRGARCLESGAETASLRLFGPAREAAGRAEDSFDATTVEELLVLATRRYPPAFATILERCRIWVNGEEVSPERAISAGDEVAVIPPVSGG
jgi:molybdopterin synthase sulfur carrier subunit